MAGHFDGRGLHAVRVGEIDRGIYSDGTASITARVHMSLDSLDGPHEFGPALTVHLSVDLIETDTLEVLELRVLQRAHELLQRIVAFSPIELDDKRRYCNSPQARVDVRQ